MTLTLRIPWIEDGIQPFLEQVGQTDLWQGLEVSAEVLDSDKGWEDIIDSFDLQLVSLSDLLPPDVSRYLAEAGSLSRQTLITYIGLLLERAAAVGATHVSIDLGVEREQGMGEGELLEVRAAILRDLMPKAERLDVTIGIPLRVPAALSLGSSYNAVRLVKQVMHRCCRLVLDVYPEELDASFQPADLLANLHSHIGAIRWHYEPYLGFRLRTRFVTAWRESLRFHGFPGLVICCPRLRDPETMAEELQRLEYLLG